MDAVSDARMEDQLLPELPVVVMMNSDDVEAVDSDSKMTNDEATPLLAASEPTASDDNLPVTIEATSVPVPAGSASASASTSTLPVSPPPLPATVVTFVSTSASGKTREWHAKYYAPSTSTGRPSVLDLPESYFAPTASELQAAFAGQVKKREGLVDAPMLTKKLRDAEEAKKGKARSDRWPQTRIRIRFTDRSQLEGVFKSTESLAAIYEFVKWALAEEYRSVPFTLYQTPPKKEYAKLDPDMKGKSMIDLSLTPSSMFYIRFDNDELNLSSTIPPLIPSLLVAVATLPAPLTFDPNAAVDPAATADVKPKINKLGFGGASGKVTPSWMRGGKTGKK